MKMNIFTFTYDKVDENADSADILNKLLEFFINEGASNVTHPQYSTLIINCNSKYSYKHWINAIIEHSIEEICVFTFNQVYQSISGFHQQTIHNPKLNSVDFAKDVKRIMDLLTADPPVRA